MSTEEIDTGSASAACVATSSNASAACVATGSNASTACIATSSNASASNTSAACVATGEMWFNIGDSSIVSIPEGIFLQTPERMLLVTSRSVKVLFEDYTFDCPSVEIGKLTMRNCKEQMLRLSKLKLRPYMATFGDAQIRAQYYVDGLYASCVDHVVTDGYGKNAEFVGFFKDGRCLRGIQKCAHGDVYANFDTVAVGFILGGNYRYDGEIFNDRTYQRGILKHNGGYYDGIFTKSTFCGKYFNPRIQRKDIEVKLTMTYEGCRMHIDGFVILSSQERAFVLKSKIQAIGDYRFILDREILQVGLLTHSYENDNLRIDAGGIASLYTLAAGEDMITLKHVKTLGYVDDLLYDSNRVKTPDFEVKYSTGTYCATTAEFIYERKILNGMITETLTDRKSLTVESWEFGIVAKYRYTDSEKTFTVVFPSEYNDHERIVTAGTRTITRRYTSTGEYIGQICNVRGTPTAISGYGFEALPAKQRIRFGNFLFGFLGFRFDGGVIEYVNGSAINLVYHYVNDTFEVCTCDQWCSYEYEAAYEILIHQFFHGDSFDHKFEYLHVLEPPFTWENYFGYVCEENALCRFDGVDVAVRFAFRRFRVLELKPLIAQFVPAEYANAQFDFTGIMEGDEFKVGTFACPNCSIRFKYTNKLEVVIVAADGLTRMLYIDDVVHCLPIPQKMYRKAILLTVCTDQKLSWMDKIKPLVPAQLDYNVIDLNQIKMSPIIPGTKTQFECVREKVVLPEISTVQQCEAYVDVIALYAHQNTSDRYRSAYFICDFPDIEGYMYMRTLIQVNFNPMSLFAAKHLRLKLVIIYTNKFVTVLGKTFAPPGGYMIKKVTNSILFAVC